MRDHDWDDKISIVITFYFPNNKTIATDAEIRFRNHPYHFYGKYSLKVSSYLFDDMYMDGMYEIEDFDDKKIIFKDRPTKDGYGKAERIAFYKRK